MADPAGPMNQAASEEMDQAASAAPVDDLAGSPAGEDQPAAVDSSELLQGLTRWLARRPESSRHDQGQAVRAFARWAHGKPWQPELMRGWLRYLKDKGNSPKTLRMKLPAVASYLRSQGKDVAPVKLPTIASERAASLSHEEALTIVTAARRAGLREYALVLLIIREGWLKKEALELTTRQAKAGAFAIRNGQRLYVSPATQKALAALAETRPSAGRLIATDDGQPMHPHAAQNRIRALAIGAGMDGCSAQRLRATYLTALMASSTLERAMQQSGLGPKALSRYVDG